MKQGRHGLEFGKLSTGIPGDHLPILKLRYAIPGTPYEDVALGIHHDGANIIGGDIKILGMISDKTPIGIATDPSASGSKPNLPPVIGMDTANRMTL